MKLSKRFLEEISFWKIVKLPIIVFHGCCQGDRGLNLEKREITGNKWFSTSDFYAGEYCWHHTRIDKFPKFRIEIEIIGNYYGIKCPENIQGEPWVPFLAECFPGIYGYNLSRHFQDSLKNHLDKLESNNVVAFISGVEICIPEVDRYVKIKEILRLPDEKYKYREQYQ